MSARFDDRQLDRILDAWLDEGPAAVSSTALAAALERVPATRRRRASRGVVGDLLTRMQPVALPLAIAASVLLAIVVFALSSRSPEVGPPPSASPPASAEATEDPGPTGTPQNQATNSAHVEISGAATERTDVLLNREAPGHRVDDTEFPGLIRSGFIDQSQERFSVSIDPRMTYAEPMVTGRSLVLRFALRQAGGLFVSAGGECLVTFTTVTDSVMEATFECTDVPSPSREGTIDATGTFSMYAVPAETPGVSSVDLTLEGSPLPADLWEFFGCPPVSITELDGDRVCRFSDGWHRLEVLGLFEPGLDTTDIATTDDGVSVRIWWYRGEIGDSLHNGDFLSTQGECQLSFTVLTDTLADATIGCTGVPGAFSTTVGGAEQESTVDLQGSFTFDPSIGALEGY